MESPLFSWIHLSDIHIGHGAAGHGWDQRLVLDCLREDIAQTTQRTVPKPDAIFITGDIGFSGNSRIRPEETASREYECAAQWLIDVGKAAGLGSDRIFVVPGNHDVNRS